MKYVVAVIFVTILGLLAETLYDEWVWDRFRKEQKCQVIYRIPAEAWVCNDGKTYWRK